MGHAFPSSVRFGRCLVLGGLVTAALGCSPGAGNTQHPGGGSSGSGATGTGGGSSAGGSGDGAGGVEDPGIPTTQNGGSATDTVDGGNCGSQALNTSVEEVVVPGNVLIVFDQSDSMNAADFGGQVRWKAASDALVQAITPNKDALTLGAVFFPSVVSLGSVIPILPCDVASVAAIDDTSSPNPQIPFMPGASFLDAWAAHWARNPLTLGTPTAAGMQRADEALSGAQLTGITAVILVTDGQPTCGANQDPINLATAWKAKGISTYVIGLPGAGSAGARVPTLSDIAAAGGTTDYIMPSDSAALQQLFSTITSKIVKHTFNGCSIQFNDTPPDPTKVFLVVTEEATGQRYSVKSGTDAWSFDGSSATLQGKLCDDTLAGRFSTIAFAFGCVDAPELH